jgi:uroporphyrinogen-III synthase
MRLLVTRPEPDNERTAAALRARGHSVMLAPLLGIEPQPAADLGPGPWGGVLITSANAARAIAAHPRKAELMADLMGLPLFAVGRRSADAAREAGFADVVSADGDAAALARLVATRPEKPQVRLPLLYLAGEDRAADLAGALAAQGIATRTVVVYRAVVATSLPPDVKDALAAGAIDGVLHYSGRSADAFTALALAAVIDLKHLVTKHYCLSAEVAAPLRQAGVAAPLVAASPDESALLALIDRA